MYIEQEYKNVNNNKNQQITIQFRFQLHDWMKLKGQLTPQQKFPIKSGEQAA